MKEEGLGDDRACAQRSFLVVYFSYLRLRCLRPRRPAGLAPVWGVTFGSNEGAQNGDPALHGLFLRFVWVLVERYPRNAPAIAERSPGFLFVAELPG
jgi:hypothetical protein